MEEQPNNHPPTTPTFELKTMADGKTPNPKYVDLLDEDPPIAGQKWGVFSFVTPWKILKRKELYFFTEFVKQWDFVKSMAKFMDFLNFVSFKYNLKLDVLMNDFQEFVKEESAKVKEASSVEDDYKNFLDKNEDKLTEKFQRDNQFQTSVYGVKQRGNFGTEDDAREHAKKTRERDPNHNVYVGPIGIWMAMDPDPYKTKEIQFMDEELNQLHHEKLKNETKARDEFERRVTETKRKAIEENLEKARKTGNKLTQTVDDNGNLVGVRETVDFEAREVSDAKANEDRLNELVKQANPDPADDLPALG
jgi:hypothetical protein